MTVHGELHGKLNRGSEDLLTSSVFGLLRYLSAGVTMSFLGNAVALNDRSLELPEEPELEFFFWPHFPGWTREPDMVIDVLEGGQRTVRLVVEAKYASGKSDPDHGSSEHPIEPIDIRDQLADQYREVLADHESGKVTARRRPVVIYLTAHSACPVEDLKESLKLLSTQGQGDGEPQLYWLGWWQLAEVLRSKQSRLNLPMQELVARDLLRLLESRGQSLLFEAWSQDPPRLPARQWTFTSSWWRRAYSGKPLTPWLFDLQNEE